MFTVESKSAWYTKKADCKDSNSDGFCSVCTQRWNRIKVSYNFIPKLASDAVRNLKERRHRHLL